MCGIVGILADAPVDADLAARMRDQLAHRGPDHAGLWRSDDGRVCLGHRRLSIIDLDARSHQPLQSSDGRLVVTFNGEIYNHRAVRTELERRGVEFRTTSDTEVLVEAYRCWGDEALDRLSGMFAFALWDRADRRLFCARDRAGEKPFYYAELPGAFLFASELKALTPWPALPRRVDYEAVIDFLALGFIADPRTIWRDVRKLPAAHALVVDLGTAGPVVQGPPRRYWSLALGAGGAAPSGEELRAVLLQAADEMAMADVPVGTFLSGGVDSSTVTAALSLSGHPVRTFTIGFEEAAYDERRWARMVAERYGTQHTERIVERSDVAAVLEHLTWQYDEPFADYSCFPTYYLCREARRSITVALSGDGADELFAGYRKYQRLARRGEVAHVFPPRVARMASAVAGLTLPGGHHWRRTLAQYGLSGADMLTDMLCIGLPLGELRRVARGPLAEALRHYDPRDHVRAILAEASPDAGLVDTMRHVDFHLTLPGDMLVKVDRASMAVALEVRPLFLHRAVMEVAARTPAAALVTRDAAKIALKDAVRPWLPGDLLDRRKQGFALPLPEWLGRDMPAATTPGSWAETLLDPASIARFGTQHAARAANYTQILHEVSTLERWAARWM